ncbi:MAG: bifunctional sulfate adenylyltransferase/adenylylsulfate kinase [Gammaproteobacteria bacterium]|nr:bifunctional sulfate adenylyltransferase/adenylylsulfate kinase [Gammaproteobacteria bacterium]
MDHLISPYGGALQNLVVNADRAAALKELARDQPAHVLTQRQLCDLELLLNGGFSPLRGFMSREVYEGVLRETQLPGGIPWSMPITLDVPEAVVRKIKEGGLLGLSDPEGFLLAILHVEEIWKVDKKREARLLYGTESSAHPGVKFFFEQTHETCVGGVLEGIQLPMHYDFETLRHTPEELRQLFGKMGWRSVVGFNTSKPMHRLHRDITLQAAKEAGASLLLHPAVGMTKPGDLHYYARVHCYQAIRRHYPHDLTLLSLLPIAVRMAGPREALHNAIVRQNYGCTHFIVGPEHCAPPDVWTGGERFYPEYAAQEFMSGFQDSLSIRIIPVKERVYVPEVDRYMPVDQIEREKKKGIPFTEKDLNRYLAHDQEIPPWYSFPEVIAELRKVCPPRSKQGFTLFFTGLSGAGKSTLAKIMYAKFIEAGGRPATLLDGDIVRHNLSSELGFSKAHRDLNIKRIGFVASEITKNSGIAICAPIAPYAATRRAVRELIEQHGAFIEIHVSTPLDVCEKRDRKGLYEKARKGIIPEFTGVSDPYEMPERPEIRIDTSDKTPAQAVQEILLYLLHEKYLTASDE